MGGALSAHCCRLNHASCQRFRDVCSRIYSPHHFQGFSVLVYLFGSCEPWNLVVEHSHGICSMNNPYENGDFSIAMLPESLIIFDYLTAPEPSGCIFQPSRQLVGSKLGWLRNMRNQTHRALMGSPNTWRM